ncbi:unnamed protein product [Staurois parvus]|uniref:Uncharacterized protein n=1 Tax=Staurois parvus TaxID=386267 RepID=A0ABN9BIU5_9NEOB|nr:unnamed protein product [Staurois parvus]
MHWHVPWSAQWRELVTAVSDHSVLYDQSWRSHDYIGLLPCDQLCPITQQFTK